MKPRISPDDQAAYQRIVALAIGTALTIRGQAATFEGMTGYLITLKIKRRTVYLRAGDQDIKEIQIA